MDLSDPTRLSIKGDTEGSIQRRDSGQWSERDSDGCYGSGTLPFVSDSSRSGMDTGYGNIYSAGQPNPKRFRTLDSGYGGEKKRSCEGSCSPSEESNAGEDMSDPRSWSQLHETVANGNFNLSTHRGSVNARGPNGITPLMIGASRSRGNDCDTEQIIDGLICQGASVDDTTDILSEKI